MTQYWLWIKGIFNGDFGRSLTLNADIGQLIGRRLPVTLSLTIPALAIAAILGIIIGVICATNRGSIVDQLLTVAVTISNGVPIFWIGIMMIHLFGVMLGWLPLMGYASPFDSFTEYLRKAAMPVAILAIRPMAEIARQVRTNMLEVINQDYIRTARAYGLSERKVKYRVRSEERAYSHRHASRAAGAGCSGRFSAGGTGFFNRGNGPAHNDFSA